MQYGPLSLAAHAGLMGRFGGLLLATALAFPVGGAVAQQTNVQDECYRNIEQYIPAYTTPDGRYQNGYLRSSRVSVPCGDSAYGYGGGVASSNGARRSLPRCDRNATIFNGLVGGGIAAALSKPDAYAWSVPLGLALGVSSSRIGCR